MQLKIVNKHGKTVNKANSSNIYHDLLCIFQTLEFLLTVLNMFWWRRKALQDYHRRLVEMKEAAAASGLWEEEIDLALKESIKFTTGSRDIKDAMKRRKSHRASWAKVLIGLLAVMGTGYCFNFYKPLHNLVERNIQDVIYPFMTCYRRITLPLIKFLPSLTELYDESCLLENPYFQVSDMECWPCENARVVLNLTESVSNAHVGLPFVLKIPDSAVALNDFENVYLTYKKIVDGNAGQISSNKGWNQVNDILNSDNYAGDAHVVWRINRMETGRVFRKLLKPPRGSQVPPHASALGIERFLLFDGPLYGHYTLPSTEGANVFLKQMAGQRFIVLEPSSECRGTCRRLSVLLEENYTLWYNWWYWRPRSLPVQNASSISIALLGSTV